MRISRTKSKTGVYERKMEKKRCVYAGAKRSVPSVKRARPSRSEYVHSKKVKTHEPEAERDAAERPKQSS